MISYWVVPTPDVQPEMNTVTFLINPAYTLNGTLDGQVGSRPPTTALPWRSGHAGESGLPLPGGLSPAA